MDIAGLLYILYLCLFIFMFTCTWLITFMLACIYLVHTTDVTRSQTGDTDWEHKPNLKYPTCTFVAKRKIMRRLILLAYDIMR